MEKAIYEKERERDRERERDSSIEAILFKKINWCFRRRKLGRPLCWFAMRSQVTSVTRLGEISPVFHDVTKLWSL